MAEVRIELSCPGCHERFHVPPSQQGKIADCPFCDGWVDVPELCPHHGDDELAEMQVEPSAEESERQFQESARQLIQNARQIEQSQRALDHRDQQDARLDGLLDRMAVVIERWESLAGQMGKVIERLGGGDPA